MSTVSIVVFSFFGGLFPALIWLWFFLKEDALHPEPKWLILSAFLSGMLAVLLVLPVEMYAKCLASGVWPDSLLTHPFKAMAFCRDVSTLNPFILWAAAEELMKYLIAVVVILWRKAVDEPVDAMIYLITIALGFSAFETGLFLLEPLGRGDITGGLLTGDLRFMGAALIHTLSSAVVGFSIAVAFYRNVFIQLMSLFTGLVLAVMLHALFNHHIMNGAKTATVFFSVWLGIIGLLLVFEYAKRITRPKQ